MKGSIAVFSDAHCEWVVSRGVSYPRLIPDPQALVTSGVLQEHFGPTSMKYYSMTRPEPPAPAISKAGTGFCETGVYCFMHFVRDYLVFFCDPGSGLKAHSVAAFGLQFQDLCRDDDGSALGGPGSFPASDLEGVLGSRGFELYMDEILPNQRIMSGMPYDEVRRSSETGIGMEKGGSRPTFKFGWLGLNASFSPGRLPYDQQTEEYEKFDKYFTEAFKVNTHAFMVSFSFNWMITTAALLENTIQSIIMALVFCWLVLVLTTWNVAVGSLGLLSVILIVLVSVGFITCLGWTLGIIESIACIVIIGVSVDYSVHIAHAYNVSIPHTADDSSMSDMRNSKAQQATATIGISLVSGVSTSVGATLFLWFCHINFFKKFGQFLLITLIVSFLVAFFLLIPMLSLIGPVGHTGMLPRVLRCRNKEQE